MNSQTARPQTPLFSWILACLFTGGFDAALMAQNAPPAGAGISPAAVQPPAYRQPGSAYVPPGINPQPAPGYQPGFGTPPAKTAAPKSSKPTAAAPSKASSSQPAAKPASHSIESRLSRLEKSDARQDQRLIALEAGAARPSGGVANVPATTSGKTYVVRPGDTLTDISARHGTTTAALRGLNRLPSDDLYVGQTLDLPATRPALEPAGGFHIVKSGEVFSVLALHYGVSQDALARANPTVYPDKLLIGERLRIPAGATRAPTEAPPAAGKPASTAPAPGTHIVGRGESLGAIAKKYGIPTASLASANKLKNPNLIVPGQRLMVPGASLPATPAPAAPATSIPAPMLASTESGITPLPDAMLPKTAAPQTPAAREEKPASSAPAYPDAPRKVSNPNRGVVAYRLERGDNIHTVANMFSTSEEKIREMNKLPADKKLKEGDEIVVPALGAVSLN